MRAITFLNQDGTYTLKVDGEVKTGSKEDVDCFWESVFKSDFKLMPECLIELKKSYERNIIS